MKKVFILFFVLFIFIYAESSNLLKIKYSEKPVKIDGVMDDSEWSDSLEYEIKYEIDPGENIKAPVKTKVYIKYDSNYLYFAFKAFDPKPEKIRARFSDRDFIFGDDLVGIMIDTFNDKRRAYEFVCNPLGIQQDFLMTEGQGEDISWDTIWDSAGEINEDGYFVEIAIPFNSITFPVNNDGKEWGLALYRIYPREYRTRLYNFPNDRNNTCFSCQFDKITGFKNIKPGRNLEITPSYVVTNSKTRDDYGQPMEDQGSTSNFGVNLRWGPTSNILVNAAINPDFSQIEADSAQLSVNSRYALYYSEKRPFFLEEANNFKTFEDVIHTRTIADPSFGVKVTGKINKTHFGTFYAEDTSTNFVEPSFDGSSLRNYDFSSKNTVVRVKQDIFKNSFIGMILTDRRGGDYSNSVGGIDGRLNFTKQDSINFQYLKSDRENPINTDYDDEENIKGDNLKINYYHRGRNWRWGAFYLDRDKDFRADLGFINQVGVKMKSAEIGYVKYSKDSKYYSEIQNNFEYSIKDDYNGNLLEEEFEYTFRTKLAKQSYFNLELEKRKEVFENIEYDDLNEFIIWTGSKPIKALAFDFSYRNGDYVDYSNNRLGKGHKYSVNVDLKPGKHLKVDIDLLFERLNVYGVKLYDARILQGTVVYNFSRRMFFRTILQSIKVDRNVENYTYEVNKESEDFVGQLLFSYKINPRTLCYIGYSTGESGTEIYKMQPFNKTLFFKISYAFGL